MRKERGITLVALVVTIIILIILATISINAVFGEGGIVRQAQKAEELYKLASEREYIEQNISAVQIKKYEQNISTKKLGEELNTRDLYHTTDWHIIKVNEKTYDTDWNFIEKGTKLEEYGNAQYRWLVNYETGEIIQLEDGNYLSLSAGDMVATTDSLIINVDSSIIDGNIGNNKQDLETQLGNGVTLENFDYDESKNSGLTSTSFNFDGIDDCIKVKYDDAEQKKKLAENGFTFEFYGKLNGGTTNPSSTGLYKGLFCYYSGDDRGKADMRFGIFEDEQQSFVYNCSGHKSYSDFSHGVEDPWNLLFKYNLEDLKKDTYITVTLDTSHPYTVSGGKYKDSSGNERSDITEEKKGEYYKQIFYINGKKIYEGDYNKAQWDSFVKDYLPQDNYFCLGGSIMSGAGTWCYSKMNVYCLRLYSRGLSKEEVEANYEKATEYHSLLEKSDVD